jgi:hypothetical protein
MKRFLLRSVGAITILGCFLAALSCAHDQQLVGITIQPDTETFGASNIPVPADAGLSVQLRALGHYIHPPVTKDITDQVAWVSNSPQIASVTSAGLLTAAGQACGGALVSATVTTNTSAGNRTSSGAVVTSTMSANVVCFTGASGNNAILTVLILPIGEGTVTVSGGGLGSPLICPGPSCALPFTIGSGPITLTAVGNNGHSFSTWSGCGQAGPPNVCTIQALDADLTVTANFQ